MFKNELSSAARQEGGMTQVVITRSGLLQDRQGRTFADVLNDPEQPFDDVLDFFSAPDRQRRMEESEIHHDRPPLAGVVRELEAQPSIDRFLSSQHPRRSKRLRQVIGVVVRMIMEQRGWKKTGKKGSLGVRTRLLHEAAAPGTYHNTGGLAFWFLRAERYEHPEHTIYPTVRSRARQHRTASPGQSSAEGENRRLGAGKRRRSNDPQ